MNLLEIILIVLLAFFCCELLARIVYYSQRREYRYTQRILMIIFGRWLISENVASPFLVDEIASVLGVDRKFMFRVLSNCSGKTTREIEALVLDKSNGKTQQYKFQPFQGFVPAPNQNMRVLVTNSLGYRGYDIPFKKKTKREKGAVIRRFNSLWSHRN